MSYQRSSPLGQTSSAGRRRSGPSGTTTVVKVSGGSTTARTTAAGTVVKDFRGTTRVMDTGTVVNYGSSETAEHRQSQDPAFAEQQAALEQQAAAAQAEAAQVESRKKYITIGAVAVAGVAAFLILRRKKGPST